MISLTSFGGGQKAQIRRQLVAEKHWITDQQFLEGLEVAEVLPGPNVLNLAVFLGQRVRGAVGAVVAFLAGCVPPFFIILVAGALYFSTFNIPAVHAALKGAAAAALGLTLANACELTTETGRRPVNLIFVLATAIAVSYFRLSLVLTLLILGGASMALYFRFPPKSEAAPR